MIELPLYEQDSNKLFSPMVIISFLGIIILRFVFPQLHWIYFLTSIFVLIGFFSYYEKNKKPIGTLILDYHQIQIISGKQKQIIDFNDFANIGIRYSGYKNKTIGTTNRTFSGMDNYIILKQEHEKYEWKFLIENETIEFQFLEMIKNWDGYEYDISNFKLNR